MTASISPAHTKGMSINARDRARQPQGRPTGGQFAEETKAASGIALPSGQADQHVHEGRTAAQWRQEAAQARGRSADSWERSDNDGFLTQWAADTIARKYELQAEIAEQGGTWQFPALLDTDGNLVPAKLVQTRFGPAWGLLSDPDNPHSDFTGFVNPSNASTPARRAGAMARKGFRVGTVRAPATAALSDGLNPLAYARRTDGGFDAAAEIVDDGSNPTD